MGKQIKIKGYYGKRKVLETITFDSDRFEDVLSGRIFIKHEDRPIRPKDGDELQSFYRQLDGSKEEQPLKDLEKIKVEYYVQDGLLFRENQFYFDIPKEKQTIVTHYQKFLVVHIEHDFDNKCQKLFLFKL